MMHAASIIVLAVGVALVLYGSVIEPMLKPRLVAVPSPATRYRDRLSARDAAHLGVSRLRRVSTMREDVYPIDDEVEPGRYMPALPSGA